MKSNISVARAALGALTTAALLSAAGASAQTLKPGLWEMANKVKSSNGQMEQAMAQAQAQMANMPPAQRKMIEDMMAKQGVGLAPGGGTSARICLTREMVEQNGIPAQAQGDCKSTNAPRIGNSMKVSFSCTNPPSRGEGTVTFLGPESYAVQMAMTSVVNGKQEKIDLDSTSKWVSADCGAIKPLALPPKK